MMRKACVLFLLACCGVSYAGQGIDCPKTLRVKGRVEAPLGWEVLNRGAEHTLKGVSIYLGHPSKAAPQVLVEAEPEGMWKIDEWAVDSDSWLECTYEGTTFTVVKKLPKGPKICRAYYKAGEFYHAGPPERIECK